MASSSSASENLTPVFPPRILNVFSQRILIFVNRHKSSPPSMRTKMTTSRQSKMLKTRVILVILIHLLIRSLLRKHRPVMGSPSQVLPRARAKRKSQSPTQPRKRMGILKLKPLILNLRRLSLRWVLNVATLLPERQRGVQSQPPCPLLFVHQHLNPEHR